MTRTLRILIVEDEAKWATAIKSSLLEIFNDLRIPCTIEVPDTIRECKNAIRSGGETPYDLISLDVHLRNDGSGDPSSGIDLLRIVKTYNAAWMVSILTGVETDETVADTYGEERARLLQNELRNRAFMTFPPERLVIMEKPLLEGDRLAARLRQLCLILRQSLVSRNLFRHLDLNCKVAVHETSLTDKETGEAIWIKKDSEEFKRAYKAYQFIKDYEKAPSSDPDQQAKFKNEKKHDVLVKSGRKLKDAEWIDDVISLRQIRFGCGEVITLPDSPNFETIAWLLRHPREEFAAHQIGGEAPEVGQEFVSFGLSAEEDETETDGSLDHEDDEGAERTADDGDDDEDNFNQRGSGRDHESDRQRGSHPEADETEADSHRVYSIALHRKQAELAGASGSRRDRLGQEIEDLNVALGNVRSRADGGRTHGSIRQHKSRAIADLKEAGQVELADHLENAIKIHKFKFSYHVEPGEYFWNT